MFVLLQKDNVKQCTKSCSKTSDDSEDSVNHIS